MMKIRVAIIAILLIGLLIVSGCASTTEPETKGQFQKTQATETQQHAVSGRTPQPPLLPDE